MKYMRLQNDIFSIFASVQWKANGVATYPSNVVASPVDSEFVRITVVPSGHSLNGKSVSGILLVEIFTKSGKGPTRAVEISDMLDDFLCRKTLSSVSGTATQLYDSSMVPNGPDKDNPTLVKNTFSVPFSYFGV